MTARFKTARMQKHYEELIFLTEVIAMLYGYMASKKKDALVKAFNALGSFYGLRYVPISGASRSAIRQLDWPSGLVGGVPLAGDAGGDSSF